MFDSNQRLACACSWLSKWTFLSRFWCAERVLLETIRFDIEKLATTGPTIEGRVRSRSRWPSNLIWDVCMCVRPRWSDNADTNNSLGSTIPATASTWFLISNDRWYASIGRGLISPQIVSFDSGRLQICDGYKTPLSQFTSQFQAFCWWVWCVCIAFWIASIVCSFVPLFNWKCNC